MTKQEILHYVGEWLNDADDNILTQVTVEPDPGYIYIKDHQGDEWIVRVESAK